MIPPRGRGADPKALGPRGRFAESLHSSYGLSFEAWSAVLIEQSGRCAICSGALDPRTVCVDTDPQSRLRGLLCLDCGTRLPFLEAVAPYLAKHGVRGSLRIISAAREDS